MPNTSNHVSKKILESLRPLKQKYLLFTQIICKKDPPTCSHSQKTNYFTGINQTIELECQMTESNPSSLDFMWSFPNNQGTQEKTRSNGRVSKVKWTPRSENDFGTAICTASNSLDSSQCMIKLELGGDYLFKISPLVS